MGTPDEIGASRFNRPEVPAPLVVWEYVFALERRIEELEKPATPQHEWDDVRWVEEEGEYEASCWCGWTDTAVEYDPACEALYDHLKANGVELER